MEKEAKLIPGVWLHPWQPKLQARLRVFCFPYAGGGSSIYRTWSEQLPAEIEICPVQLPGRELRWREKPFRQMSDLIEPLVQALLPYLDKPYAFFGHSMGGLVSFELARTLRRAGHQYPPVRLCISGSQAPQLLDPDPPRYHLSDADFLEEVRRLQGTPEAVLENQELLHLVLPLLRADFELCETYQYVSEAPLSCPISAFGGLEDREISRDDLLAWKEQTTGSFNARFLAGNHFFLHKQQSALLFALAHDLLSDL